MVTKLDKVLGRMTDMEHQTIEKDFFGQIYGGTGTGKTILAAQLAQELREDGRVFWVDSSDGWVSLDDPKLKHLKQGVVHYPYTDAQELALVPDAIRTHKKGFADFKVVVIDESTSISTSLINKILRQRLGMEEGEIPTEPPAWTDYFPAGVILFQIIEAFHAIPGVHVILVAHDQLKQFKRNEDTIERTMPDYNPKLNSQISKPLHVSAHLTSQVRKNKEGTTYERTLQCLPTALVEAKSRVSGLELKMSAKDFITTIGDWIFGGAIEQDLQIPEDENAELPEDTYPDDALEVEEDDEGILVKDE